MIARCPKCYVVVYSDYGKEGGKWTTFVRAGTLDDEAKILIKPDIHIFTSSKMEWVDLTSERERGVPIVEERAYTRREVWSKESNERFDALKRKMKEAGSAE